MSDPNRHTRARVLKWTKDGMPDFGHDVEDSDMALKRKRNNLHLLFIAKRAFQLFEKPFFVCVKTIKDL